MQRFTFDFFPNLKTERLLLRALSNHDVTTIFELRSDKKVNALIKRETPDNIEDARKFIAICHEEFQHQNRIFWGMEFQNNIIGTIVFHRISAKEHYAEIGYELFPKFQKQGFMSEAMKEVLEFGIQKMNLKVIEAYTHKNNIPSQALLKKYDFVLQPDRKCESFEHNRIFRREV